MALGAGIASGVLSASQAYSSGKLSNVQNRYSAKSNMMNAQLAEQQAQSALRKGEKEQQMIMTKGAKLKGEQKVAYGANGIDLSSRSAQNVMNEADYFTEADRLQASANAISEAWNHRLQAAQYQGQALISKSQVTNPLKGALMSGLASGLTAYVAAGGKFDELDGITDTIKSKWNEWTGGGLDKGVQSFKNTKSYTTNYSRQIDYY